MLELAKAIVSLNMVEAIRALRARGASDEEIRDEILGMAHDFEVEKRPQLLPREVFMAIVQGCLERALEGNVAVHKSNEFVGGTQ
jgi:hypothetical protein